jgi:hypothetical protein
VVCSARGKRDAAHARGWRAPILIVCGALRPRKLAAPTFWLKNAGDVSGLFFFLDGAPLGLASASAADTAVGIISWCVRAAAALVLAPSSSSPCRAVASNAPPLASGRRRAPSARLDAYCQRLVSEAGI